MKTIISLLTGITFLGGAAWAANPDQPSNPFREPLSAPRAPRITFNVPDDLVSNPLSAAHLAEQTIYEQLYALHYSAILLNAPQASKPALPRALDDEGHPLWFDGGSGELTLGRIVEALLDQQKFDDLDRLFKDWESSTEKMADGRRKLFVFEKALRNSFSQAVDWDGAKDAIQKWRHAHPKSRSAAFVEAIFWMTYAWNVRGDGPGRSVSPDARRIFRERLETAEKILRSNRESLDSSPLWSRLLISVQTYLGRDWAEVQSVFKKAVKVHYEYHPIFSAAATQFTPKWGGSWDAVENFAQEMLLMLPPVEGREQYAQLYWSLMDARGSSFDLFRQTKASWPIIKAGMRGVMRLTPHSAYNLSRYAALACMAGDKDTFLAARAQLGSFADSSVFRANYSKNLCDQRYVKQTG